MRQTESFRTLSISQSSPGLVFDGESPIKSPSMVHSDYSGSPETSSVVWTPESVTPVQWTPEPDIPISIKTELGDTVLYKQQGMGVYRSIPALKTSIMGDIHGKVTSKSDPYEYNLAPTDLHRDSHSVWETLVAEARESRLTQSQPDRPMGSGLVHLAHLDPVSKSAQKQEILHQPSDVDSESEYLGHLQRAPSSVFPAFTPLPGYYTPRSQLSQNYTPLSQSPGNSMLGSQFSENQSTDALNTTPHKTKDVTTRGSAQSQSKVTTRGGIMQPQKRRFSTKPTNVFRTSTPMNNPSNKVSKTPRGQPSLK